MEEILIYKAGNSIDICSITLAGPPFIRWCNVINDILKHFFSEKKCLLVASNPDKDSIIFDTDGNLEKFEFDGHKYVIKTVQMCTKELIKEMCDDQQFFVFGALFIASPNFENKIVFDDLKFKEAIVNRELGNGYISLSLEDDTKCIYIKGLSNVENDLTDIKRCCEDQGFLHHDRVNNKSRNR